MNSETIFMVRGSEEGTGFFNCNFEVKILYFIFTLLLIFIDKKQNKRSDYIAILRAGTISWSICEFFMQKNGVRVLKAVYVFGWELPFILQIIFKGCVEGACVAVCCCFFSDRVIPEGVKNFSKSSRLIYSLIYGLLMILLFLDSFRNGVQTPNYGGEVPSKRAMYGPRTLLFLTIYCLVGVVFVFRTKYSDLRKRCIFLFIFMVIFGTVWTVGEFFAGTRWIEVGTFESSVHAPPFVEFFALFFDVVVEIALVYVPFFVLPVIVTKTLKSKME